MPVGLEIALAPERLDEGSPEERACFGLFTMRVGDIDLTGGMDHFIAAYRPGPLVSGYHVAEWLAWNWWRLRWEPRSAAPDWWRAHKMTAIGEGYVWPNLTIFSDGVRTALLSDRSARPDAKPFRYLGAPPCVLPSSQFEAAVDAFIPRILGRLREREVGDTNLDRVWADVLAERADPALARRRRLEALMACDAEDADREALDQLIEDSAALGEGAVDELAADHAYGGALLHAAALQEIAERQGFEAEPRNAARLPRRPSHAELVELPAWRVGVDAARTLRAQVTTESAVLRDSALAEMAGVDVRALTQPPQDNAIAFALDRSQSSGRVVLRSRWPTGRRFELARLLADRVAAPPSGPLHVATRAYTYRQKLQRAFAAELLSPFEAVDAMLDGDYSAEAQQGVAEHFQVSVLTIRTLLVNHQRIERDELGDDLAA